MEIRNKYDINGGSGGKKCVWIESTEIKWFIRAKSIGMILRFWVFARLSFSPSAMWSMHCIQANPVKI